MDCKDHPVGALVKLPGAAPSCAYCYADEQQRVGAQRERDVMRRALRRLEQKLGIAHPDEIELWRSWNRALSALTAILDERDRDANGLWGSLARGADVALSDLDRRIIVDALRSMARSKLLSRDVGALAGVERASDADYADELAERLDLAR